MALVLYVLHNWLTFETSYCLAGVFSVKMPLEQLMTMACLGGGGGGVGLVGGGNFLKN